MLVTQENPVMHGAPLGDLGIPLHVPQNGRHIPLCPTLPQSYLCTCSTPVLRRLYKW